MMKCKKTKCNSMGALIVGWCVVTVLWFSPPQSPSPPIENQFQGGLAQDLRSKIGFIIGSSCVVAAKAGLVVRKWTVSENGVLGNPDFESLSTFFYGSDCAQILAGAPARAQIPPVNFNQV